MRFNNPLLNRFWRFSTSFQLGIPVLVSITILITWGTIVESMYDAYAAQKLVYRSWMMYVSMALLIYNLAIVMVDRWPWKKRHAPFLLVHIGIILIILGGGVTQKFGIDGSMAIPVNGKNNYVSVSETDLVVYATFDGDRYTKFFENEVDFFSKPPTEQEPFRVSLGSEELIIKKYYKYARVNKKIITGDSDNDGASVKFQLQNANVKQVETLTQPSRTKSTDVNLGPLKIYLGHEWESKGRKQIGLNEIYLQTDSEKTIRYALFNKDEQKPYKNGVLNIGDSLLTAWMGLELRLLDYIPKAREEWEAIPLEKPTPLTTGAILLSYGGREHWLLLNDIVKLFGQDVAYLVSYQNRRIDIGFEVFLKHFNMTHYEGTQKAKTYSSDIRIHSEKHPDVDGHIAMNEPVKFGGFTFYQASYNQDEKTGEVLASVLSVNYDPGRVIKYLGSLIMSLGIVWLFIQTRKRKTAQ